MDEEQLSNGTSTAALKWYYFGARYYDPEIGRWMAVDPLSDKYPHLNPYNYVGNNPLSNIDNDGRAYYTL
ncbi:MAG TPA: hypothetical protein ENO18_06165, partial [Caldithrix sp.]|nr:hypothetical protein [Caldithrix sp.]